jgi:outer membrane receptor protein involved in Fe transport
VNSLNCETQLLQDCAAFGPPGGDFVQADHDQHWDATSGMVLNDRHNGWFSFDAEYGSGLSIGDTTLCPPFPQGDAINCKVPPHLTFDAAKGFSVGNHAKLAFAIRNLFNDRYAIVLDSSLQGTHYARPRTLELRLFLGGT